MQCFSYLSLAMLGVQAKQKKFTELKKKSSLPLVCHSNTYVQTHFVLIYSTPPLNHLTSLISIIHFAHFCFIILYFE